MNLPGFSPEVKPGGVVPNAEAAARVHGAFRIAVVAVVAMTATTLFYVYLAFHFGGWQLFALVADATVLTLALLASAVLIRRGRVKLGMWLFLIAMQVTFVIDSALIAGQGWALASVALLTVVIAPQTLPTRQSSRAMFTGVIAGLAALLVDVFQLPNRLPAPEPLLSVVPIIIAAVVLIYGYSLYRQFGSYTLRAKLITAFLLVTLIPLGVSAYLNDRTTRATLTTNIGSGMKALANTQALIFGNELDRQVTELRSLSQNHDLRAAAAASNAATTGTPESIQAEINKLDLQWRAADAADDDNDPLVYPHLNNPIAERLRDFRSLLPDNVEVFITDQHGALVAATNRTSDYYQADEDWWQATYHNGQGATYLGPLEYDESSKTYASNIAVPIYAEGGKTLIGVLRTTLRLKTLLDTVNVVRLGQTGRMEFFILGHQTPGTFQGQKLTGAGEKPAQVDEVTAAQIETAAKSDYIDMTYDGVPSLVSPAPVITSNPELADAVANLGWMVVVHQDRSEGLATLLTQTRATLLLVLVMAAVVIGVAIGGAQLLSGPITRLTATARRVTAGDLSAQATVEAQDETGALAHAFNTMVAQLRQTLASLEQRVAERTAELSLASERLRHRFNQLETSAQVARAATTLTDPEQLLTRAVELIQQRFDFYYVGLFLMDAEGRYAVLQRGTGEAGRAMQERRHRLEVGGQSMVGWACANKRARIALDVGAEAVRFANPLLPDTRSEMALPLMAGDRVLGALDIQSTQAAAFDQNDIAALQGMADQVAVALENARLFQQAQTALGQLETTNRLLVRQGWQGYLERPSTVRRSVLAMAPTPVDAPDGNGADGSGAESLAMPLELRGQRLGQLKLRREGDRPWTEGEKEMIQAVALQTILAADNARMVEQTQFALQETEGLFAAARDIAQAAQIQDISQSLASYVNVLEQADRTIVTLVDTDRRQILARVGAGNLEGELDMTFDEFDAGLGGQVLRSGEPVLSLSADDPKDPEGTREQRMRHPEGVDRDVGSLIIVPLGVKGQVLGTVSIVNRTHQRKFDQRNVDLAMALAGPAATALENVRLLEATRRRAEREERIRHITTRVRAAGDIRSILETTAAELAQAMGVSRAIVRLTAGDAQRGNSTRALALSVPGNGHSEDEERLP